MESDLNLTLSAYNNIKKLYWVLDDPDNPSYDSGFQRWYGWKATGKTPPPNSEQGEWRRPTFGEADRRQFEWDNHIINYVHWHSKMHEILDTSACPGQVLYMGTSFEFDSSLTAWLESHQ